MKFHPGLTLLLLPLLTIPQARAADICEVILCSGVGCYEGRFRTYQLEEAECDRPAIVPGYTDRTFSKSMAPNPVVIECEPMGGGDYLCEAFPTGEFTYSWSTTGPLSLPYPGSPEDNAQWVSCNGPGTGVLTVSAAHEDSPAGSRNKYISCSAY